MGEQRARVDALTLNARDWPRHRATVTDTATPRARRAPRDEAQFSSDSLHAIAEGGGGGAEELRREPPPSSEKTNSSATSERWQD
jgi:hypothetical protein